MARRPADDDRTMKTTANRRRLAAAVVLLAALGGAAGFVQWRADAACRRVAAERDALAARIDARDPARTPLVGESTAGNAFDHYAGGIVAAHALQDTQFAGLRPLLAADDATVAGDPLRAQWQPIVAALRAGAQAAAAKAPRTGPLTKSGDGVLDLLAVRWAANAAAFEARALLHEGRDEDAVRSSLAGLTLGLDVTRSELLINQLIGAASTAIGTDVWTEARIARLAPAARALLAKGLDALDAQWPLHVDVEGELRFGAEAIAAMGPQAADLGDDFAASAWRHGFSARWRLADMFLRYADVCRAANALRGEAWPTREASLKAALAAEDAAGNLFAARIENAERQLREVAAGVRLLRMAIDVHDGREAAARLDPLADGTIAVAATTDGVRLSCAGGDTKPRLQRLVAR